jgi:hypothetical protein
MEEFLQRLKLIDHFTLELEVEKPVFVERMRQVVDPGNTSMLTASFDVFRSGNKEYKGDVDDNGFQIRRRRRFFDTNRNFALAKGTIRQKDNYLIVDTQVSSFSTFFLIFYIFLLVIYAIVIVSLFLTEESSQAMMISIPAILLHASFMIVIPYFVLRRSTQRMKYDLTRELHFIASSNQRPG